mmetsp:Transcript_18707/g.44931  ORF Transcript_18707/g.44931 Transcript_18707/m.44931 type:complete len:406 (-) Transcript_18707:387-1604(-)
MAANENEIDDDLPPLEDMSEAISAARKMREGEESEKVDGDLYSSVLKTEPAKPSPPTAGARIKVHGLVRAAQYNGQMGQVLRFDSEAQKFEVKLDSGKELKIKEENLEVLEKFGGMKGGFMKAGLGTTEDPDVIKPKNALDGLGPMDQLKAVGAKQTQDVPEWMKPSRELLDKVDADQELKAAADNHKLLKAVDEVSKDPSAWTKYQDDPEVVNYFKKMMGLFGEQFQEHEKKKGKEGGGEFGGVENIFTPQGQKASMIEEISSSGMAKAKRAEVDKKKKGAAPAAGGVTRKVGTMDYSKFDHIESDEDEDEDGIPTYGLAKEIRGLLADGGKGKMSKNDPKVASALADPKVQRVLRTLKTCDDPERIAKLMEEEEVKEKMQILIATGALDIRPPGQRPGRAGGK